MSVLKLWPYKLVDNRFIHFTPWSMSSGEKWLSVEEALVDWDFSVPVALQCVVTWSDDELRASAGLSDNAELAVITTLDCPSVGTRETWVTPLEKGASPLTIDVETEPGELAELVSIENNIVVTGTSDGWTASHRVGVKLMDPPDRITIRFEVGGSRFPTEAYSFKAAKLPALDWKVIITPNEDTIWSSDFVTSVRLAVNTDFPNKDAILNVSHPGFETYSVLAQRDILVSLFLRVAAAAFDHEIVEQIVPGSIGEAITRYSRLILKTSTLEALEFARTRPLQFIERINLYLPLPALDVKTKK